MTAPGRRRDNLEAIAYHEAGHAVVAYLNKLTFKNLSIVPDADQNSDGHITHGPWLEDFNPAWGTNLEQMAYLETRVVCSLAGPEAERRYRGRWSHIRARRDREQAIDLIFNVSGSSEQAQAYFDDCHRKAREALDNHWSAVEAVAQALLEKMELTGAQARQIIKKAWAS